MGVLGGEGFLSLFLKRKENLNIIATNIRDIRSFSGTKWKKNLEKRRAEAFLVYPLLYDPSVTQ